MQRSDIEIQFQLIHQNVIYSETELEMNKPFREQGYDSLDETEFVITVEKEYNLRFDESRLADLKTPDQLIDMVIFQIHLSEGTDAVAPI